MADVGDVYQISTTVTDTAGDPVDPATVSVSVTAPDGTTSTPATANPAVGSYTADVSITEAGRWTWTWSTTDPTGVDHGHLDVPVSPPARLRPLATTTDIEARLGRDLTASESAVVGALLADASAAIRRFCRQDFDLVTDDQVILRPLGMRLRLPQRPVTAVTAVVAVGSNGLPDLPISGWTWDGIDIVNIAGLSSNTFVSLPAWWDDFDADINTYRVTYSHGFPITPDEIVGKTCQLALRSLSAASAPEGVTQMTVGQYSEQYQQATGATGAVPVLTRADQADLIAWGYRRTAGTIGLRA